MNAIHHSDRPVDVEERRGVARLIRRVCLLREQGEVADAEKLQAGELARAIRDHRLQHGPDSLPESELRELYVVEARRAADALALAELLIPQLTRQPTAARTRSEAVAIPVPMPPAVRMPEAGVPAIPDLLDAMLAAERKARRPMPASAH
ncbi:MAG: hypothetical protein JNG83_03090 [Opitutaceae bacterium]|nr:hypothetical protein [Opitutaceae bacterium]